MEVLYYIEMLIDFGTGCIKCDQSYVCFCENWT